VCDHAVVSEPHDAADASDDLPVGATPGAGPSPVEQAVLDANQRFYSAFEARDVDAMADVWERSSRASVTHPGWPTLHGWAKVIASWDAIFRGTPYIQFFLTDARAVVVGDAAWVVLDENILQSHGDAGAAAVDPASASTVAATNVFVHDGEDWRLVNHHGSPVASHARDLG
jgi:ketosteroid isomerase-like protein